MPNIAPVISSHHCNFAAFSDLHAEIKPKDFSNFKNAELKVKMITCKLSIRKLCFQSHIYNAKRVATSDVFKSNQKVELSNQTWTNNSNCEANHSIRISANSMRMPIAFSLGFSL